MRCNYIGDYGQCLQDAVYDLKIKTDKQEWGKPLCDDHLEEERDVLRSYIDRIARENIVQETCEQIKST